MIPTFNASFDEIRVEVEEDVNEGLEGFDVKNVTEAMTTLVSAAGMQAIMLATTFDAAAGLNPDSSGCFSWLFLFFFKKKRQFYVLDSCVSVSLK